MLGLTVAEALAVGVLASAIGVAAGVGLAAGLERASPSRRGSAVAGTALVVETSALVLAAVVGVVVTLVASVAPAVKASRVAPGGPAGRRRRPVSASWVRGLLGVVVAGTGIAATVGGTAGEGSPPMTGLGAPGRWWSASCSSARWWLAPSPVS